MHPVVEPKKPDQSPGCSWMMPMTAFDEFESLCRRFRVAGEINGCIWELLAQLRELKGVGVRACERVLRELRNMMADLKRDQEPIEQAAMALLDDARDWAAPRGPAVRWLSCKPGGEGRSKCDECGHPEREQRAIFRDGERARNELLHRINIDDLAKNQVLEVRRARMLFWSLAKVMDRAQEVLVEPEFENRCYAEATFGFLDKAASLLAKKDASERSWRDVRGVVWMKGATPEGMTLYGRFGAIVRDILQSQTQEMSLDDATQSMEGPGGSDADEDDFREEMEAILSRLPEKTQKLARSVLRNAEAGSSPPDAIHQAADELGLGRPEASRMFSEFQQAVMSRERS
jgi:hypothetical protein